MTNWSRAERIQIAKIKFPSEFEEWEKRNNELEEIRNQMKKRGEDSQSLQNELGKLNVTILLLELAMEITDKSSLKPLRGIINPKNSST